MSESNTPRTDEAEIRVQFGNKTTPTGQVSVKFARELEIELSAVRKELEEAKSSADTVCDSYAAENQRLHDRALAAEAALAAAQKRYEFLRGRTEWRTLGTMRWLKIEMQLPDGLRVSKAADELDTAIDEAIRALSAQKDGDTDA